MFFALVPDGAAGDAVVKAAAAALQNVQLVPLLNPRIYESYLADTARLRQAPGVSSIAVEVSGTGAGHGGRRANPRRRLC